MDAASHTGIPIMELIVMTLVVTLLLMAGHLWTIVEEQLSRGK